MKPNPMSRHIRKSSSRSRRLDANLLSRLPAASFRGLRSLLHLRLDDNVLTEVPFLALRDLPALQALTLALNDIRHVPDGAFSSLTQLLLLDLSFNRISSFPAAIRHLNNLRDLNLQNNNISVVPGNSFSGNPSIEAINIQNNPLHTVGHSSFQLLPDLHTLSLSGSLITELPDFTGTSRLETLSITGSHISTLPDNLCEELPHLQKLDLSHNLIHSLPSFSSCRKIQNIDLSSNRLSSVSVMSLTHLKPSGHLQLTVSHQHQTHRLRKSDQLVTSTCVFLLCASTRSEDSNSLSICCLDTLSLWLLHFLFIVSIVFNLLLLVCLLPLVLHLPPPSTSSLLPASSAQAVSADSSKDTDPGSGVPPLRSLSSS
ncbi:leucine-rich repeat-containing G-protein coupled receptor 5 [Etheostoma spectabile]|uniref:leucine-rich repeat-containing G-protein coupled receptor 5 n=1 Tax=Etheostoma spectabile TaxID=54343 RepID=UPI0013AF5609|nr:leucine-rich repeat-containing G-protein coupled receptor 5-like [Etheostoma spectabile]